MMKNLDRLKFLIVLAMSLSLPEFLSADVITFKSPTISTIGGKVFPENPNFVEAGMHVEAFWALRMGKPNAHFIKGHFHPPDLSTGFEGQHFGWNDELHGIYIDAKDGSSFDLISIDYRVTANRQSSNRSITGFYTTNVHLLINTEFNPRLSVLTQFMAYSLGMALGNDETLPFQTLHSYAFYGVRRLFIASTGSVDITNIVIKR